MFLNVRRQPVRVMNTNWMGKGPSLFIEGLNKVEYKLDQVALTSYFCLFWLSIYLRVYSVRFIWLFVAVCNNEVGLTLKFSFPLSPPN